MYLNGATIGMMKTIMKSPENDPKGAATGPHRVIRGGNWSREPAISRVAYRISVKVGYGAIGFRLASSL